MSIKKIVYTLKKSPQEYPSSTRLVHLNNRVMTFDMIYPNKNRNRVIVKRKGDILPSLMSII